MAPLNTPAPEHTNHHHHHSIQQLPEQNAEHVSSTPIGEAKMAHNKYNSGKQNKTTAVEEEGEEEQPKRVERNVNQDGGIRMKINGKWLHLSEAFVKSHPGGPVLTQYKDTDATHIFHAFHEGSQKAYKQLALLKGQRAKNISGTIFAAFEQYKLLQPLSSNANGLINNAGSSGKKDQQVAFDPASVVAQYDIPIGKEKQIVQEFEQLRQQVHANGLMQPRPFFYWRKVVEVLVIFALALFLQYYKYFLGSAMVLALVWQQMGWLGHEFCHHQPGSQNRRFNDWFALVLGNVAQGYSRDWWKDKHNLHHAATNVIERDGDIDLTPLLALVPDHMGRYKTLLAQWLLRSLLPYQHWYFTATYPFLRISWTVQSILHVWSAPSSEFKKHRDAARAEQLALFAHWCWVGLQLWLLPSMPIRLLYFAISQLGAGLLIALVVSYNHNSLPKFPEHSGLMNNFAALHMLTTRNMRSSIFVDWLWGGLNYQIEHHLFPTMPRPNLSRCAKLVQQFCARTGLPYMVDDFLTGYMASLRLLRQVSEHAVANNNNTRSRSKMD